MLSVSDLPLYEVLKVQNVLLPAPTTVLLVSCKTGAIHWQCQNLQFGEHNLGWKDLV